MGPLEFQMGLLSKSLQVVALVLAVGILALQRLHQP